MKGVLPCIVWHNELSKKSTTQWFKKFHPNTNHHSSWKKMYFLDYFEIKNSTATIPFNNFPIFNRIPYGCSTWRSNLIVCNKTRSYIITSSYELKILTDMRSVQHCTGRIYKLSHKLYPRIFTKQSKVMLCQHLFCNSYDISTFLGRFFYFSSKK